MWERLVALYKRQNEWIRLCMAVTWKALLHQGPVPATMQVLHLVEHSWSKMMDILVELFLCLEEVPAVGEQVGSLLCHNRTTWHSADNAHKNSKRSP